jgi:choline-sulfatase
MTTIFPTTARAQVARASYYGLCSFADDLLGRLMRALEDTGRDADTAVIFTSDHGELNGDHGLWTKMCLYEGAMGVPLILGGAGAPRGVADTQASLVDVHQTVIEAAGEGLSDDDRARPGRSLYDLAARPDPDRVVLSEYHDGGSITGFFGVRVGDWKYAYYPGFAPQLFDLAADPFEETDLGLSAAHADVRAACHAKLSAICDPDAVNAACFAAQARRIEELGGADAIVNAETYDHTPVEA